MTTTTTRPRRFHDLGIAPVWVDDHGPMIDALAVTITPRSDFGRAIRRDVSNARREWLLGRVQADTVPASDVWTTDTRAYEFAIRRPGSDTWMTAAVSSAFRAVALHDWHVARIAD